MEREHKEWIENAIDLCERAGQKDVSLLIYRPRDSEKGRDSFVVITNIEEEGLPAMVGRVINGEDKKG